MLGTCDSVHHRWCKTLLGRETPSLSYPSAAQWLLQLDWGFAASLSVLKASDDKTSVKAQIV